MDSVDKLFGEKDSGKNNADRTKLTKMLDYVREGDVIRTKSAERLVHSMIDLLVLVRDRGERGVHVEFVLTVMAGTAELEPCITSSHRDQASKAYLARGFGVPRSTLHSALAGRGVYGQHEDTETDPPGGNA